LKIDTNEIRVKSGEVVEVPVRVQVDAYNLEKRSNELHFTLQATDRPELRVVEDARFLGPAFR